MNNSCGDAQGVLAGCLVVDFTQAIAGPFATREAAEKALQQLKSLGLQPGAVTSRSG